MNALCVADAPATWLITAVSRRTRDEGRGGAPPAGFCAAGFCAALRTDRPMGPSVSLLVRGRGVGGESERERERGRERETERE